MPLETLLDLFDEIIKIDAECAIYHNGLRDFSYSYNSLGRDAPAMAAWLGDKGISKGDRIIIWGENRIEWVVAFWGGLLAGAIIVPIDYRSPADFVERVHGVVQARIIFSGEEVPTADLTAESVRAITASLTDTFENMPQSRASIRAVLSADDTAEIIFTSGATAEPKGVVITHKNILSNIGPIGGEWTKYRKYARPFLPLRFLNLLPMSHLFGQAMALFIPPLVESTVVFLNRYDPKLIVALTKRLRVSVIVSVPKVLELLREYITALGYAKDDPTSRKRHWILRWLVHRKVHRLFGLKFWSFVVGAAPLDPELEEFWSKLGFLVVQGYGLTETAPIVSLNHPLNARSGSVGKAMPGLEIRLSEDGEILVRGDSVSRGYYKNAEAGAEVFEDGWLHTGDIGGLDEEGRLYIRGRKKEMIVTPEGLNVFPEDVERVLNSLPGVMESAVVGIHEGTAERVHAVIVTDSGSPAFKSELLRQANAQLADHQKLRGITIWPGERLPRTEGTLKLKRRDIKRFVEAGTPERIPASNDVFKSILEKYTSGRAFDEHATISELGLSSLERIELMLDLEAAFGSSVNETAITEASDLSRLRELVSSTGKDGAARTPHEEAEFPHWNLSLIARLVRNASLLTWIIPLTRLFAWIRVEGKENLKLIEGPVMFAANHESHMDVPVVFASLPWQIRSRLAVAMAKEFFAPHFHPDQHSTREWLTNSLNYFLASLLFNAFPLPRREAGSRAALGHIGTLAGNGYSTLIFPEGRRSETGAITKFQPGIGMIASRLELAVVPVRIDGLERVLRVGSKMARPGRVRVAFGAPMHFHEDDYAKIARQVEEAVRNL